jgi:tetrahydromethanopterin S-methyltransferase subunit A
MADTVSKARATLETSGQHHALQVVSEQLAEATAAVKCHGCGCLHQTVAALEQAKIGTHELASVLADARAVFAPKKYDCLGCVVCFPAVAANAFTEVFPELGSTMDLCPTEAPQERDGWPPLPGDYRVLRHGAPVAVCTLNSDRLMDELARRGPEGLAIVGTMRTENLGIERLIRNTLGNPNLRYLVLCGDDTRQAIGHLPGQSLQALFEHGIDGQGRIRGASGKRPVLKNVTPAHVAAFRRQVELVALVGETSPAVVSDHILRCAKRAPESFEEPFQDVSVPLVEAREAQRLVLDPAGYFVIYPDARGARLVVEHFSNAGVLDVVIQGKTPSAICSTLIDRALITRLDHAAYLGRELARAEQGLRTNEPFVQDRASGELLESGRSTPAPERGGLACPCETPSGGDGRCSEVVQRIGKQQD